MSRWALSSGKRSRIGRQSEVVKLNPRELRRQIGRRGLTAAELAALSHLSPATVRKALGGRPISPRSLRAIATALEESPACSDELVAL